MAQAAFRVETNLPEIRKKLDAVARRFPKVFDKTVKTAGNRVIAELQRATPKQSGATARAYVNKRLRLATYEITNIKETEDRKHFVSDLLERGTKAHGPVKFKFLRFKSLGRRARKRLGIKRRKGTGKFVFTKWVKGIKAMRIFEKTLPKARAIVRQHIERMLKIIAKRI